jgi:hypothetical protein
MTHEEPINERGTSAHGRRTKARCFGMLNKDVAIVVVIVSKSKVKVPT